MSHGGARPGAGRIKGVPNKASIKRQADIAKDGLTPLDYMLSVLRDPGADEKRRDWAAKESAPYVHPKLAATDLNANVDATVKVEIIGFGKSPYPRALPVDAETVPASGAGSVVGSGEET